MEIDQVTLHENQLLHVCSAIGGIENGRYVPGDEATDCLKDIKRFLRLDEQDEEKPTHQLLGKWNILSTDLIPLLLVAVEKQNWKQAITCCEVMVPITWPLPPNAPEFDIFRLRKYKSAFLVKNVWKSILTVILYLCSTPSQKRSMNDDNRIRLMICLIRNVLAIPDSQVNSNSSTESFNESCCQEDLIKIMHEEEIIEFILSLGASANELEYRAWNTLILECFYHIFKDRNIKSLTEPTLNIQKEQLREKLEQELSKNRVIKGRHSRFGGTFSLKTQKGSQINVRSLKSAISLDEAFDKGKKDVTRFLRRPFDPLSEKPFLRPGSPKLFNSIAKDFLENCMNYLLPSIKKDFDVEKILGDQAYLHFFSLLGFFLELHLSYNQGERNFDQITALIDGRMLLFAAKRIMMYRDEKNWKFMFFALKSLQQLFGALKRMDCCEDEGVKQASLQIQSQYFYEEANLSMLVSLTKDSQSKSKRHLECVVDTIARLIDLIKSNWDTDIGLVTRKTKVTNSSQREPGYESSDDEEISKPVVISGPEKTFSIMHLYVQFGNENVVETYTNLLNYYDQLSEQTLKQILAMFQYISDTEICNKEALFYNIKTFEAFRSFLKNPVTSSEKYNGIKAFIRLVIKSALDRINEQPIIILELFYSKSKSDIYRIQNGDEDYSILNDYNTSDKPLPTNEELEKEFSVPKTNYEARGAQVRAFSNILEANSDGRDFVKWLATVMRKLLYEDLEDIFETDDFDVKNVKLSDFVYHHSSPFFIADFVNTRPAELLFGLLSFERFEDTWKFPPEIDINMIEQLEKKLLFARRLEVQKLESRKRPRKEKQTKEGNQDELEYSEADEPQERDFVKKTRKFRKNDEFMELNSDNDVENSSKKTVKKSSTKSVVAIQEFKSEKFVVNSSDDGEDEAFFENERRIREKRDELARLGILTNGMTQNSSSQSQSQTLKDSGKKVEKTKKLNKPKKDLSSKEPNVKDIDENDKFEYLDNHLNVNEDAEQLDKENMSGENETQARLRKIREIMEDYNDDDLVEQTLVKPKARKANIIDSDDD